DGYFGIVAEYGLGLTTNQKVARSSRAGRTIKISKLRSRDDPAFAFSPTISPTSIVLLLSDQADDPDFFSLALLSGESVIALPRPLLRPRECSRLFRRRIP